MGRMLGVPYFVSAEEGKECLKMESDMRRVQKVNRQMRSEQNTLLRAFNASKEGSKTINSTRTESEDTIIKWVSIIRAKWQGHVIRRSSQSVDYQGGYINGLPPFSEHVLQLTLYDAEYDHLEAVANEIEKGGKEAVGSVSLQLRLMTTRTASTFDHMSEIHPSY